MFSLNVPVPPAVARLASGLAGTLHTARVREHHGLVAKRLGETPKARRVRRALADADAAPFAIRTTGIDTFDRPPAGPGPVAYLVVESPELYRLHERLCETFEPVAGMEGAEYDPHVTIARGGDAADLLDRDPPEPREWTVERLELKDASRDLAVETVALPA